MPNRFHPLPINSWFFFVIKSTAIVLTLLTLLQAGCSYIISPPTAQIAENVSAAILNQNDPATVREGAPAYLILLDGLIAGDPEEEQLLLAGARLYDSYAAVFVEDKKRAQRLTEKSWDYSKRALCQIRPDDCQAYQQPYAEYIDFLTTLDDSDVPVLYAFGASWASWIQTHEEDWNARADIPKVLATMQQVVKLDDTYLQGDPYIYLGVLAILLPPALGGKPDQAREYFERAIALSGGRNLMFKVIFAERYGRMMFDRELHDRLLHEVLAADPVAADLTLMNTIAQQQARDLLASSDEYF